jgi:hypothetical protein
MQIDKPSHFGLTTKTQRAQRAEKIFVHAHQAKSNKKTPRQRQ